MIDHSATSHYLWLDVEIVGDPPAEVDLMRHQLTSPWPAVDHLRASFVRTTAGWTVETQTTGHRTSETATESSLTSLAAAELVYRRTHMLVRERADEHGWGRLHAATVDIGTKRIVIAGASGFGKTTLARELARRGANVQSDEAALIKGGLCVGLPRRIHVKDNADVCLTEDERNSAVLLDYEPGVWALDPPRPGALTVAPIDAVVLLGPRGDNEPVVEPVASGDAFQELIPEAAWLSPAGLAVTAVAELLRQVPVWRLSGGDAPSARGDTLEMLVS